jgi:hypothetical protein
MPGGVGSDVVEVGMRDSRGDPSKRFWGFFLVFWVSLGVISLIARGWWTVALAAGGILHSATQLRNANPPDKPVDVRPKVGGS